MAEIDDLSTTDASNTARFPEGMLPSAVNDAARALEGILARFIQYTSGENFVAATEVGVNSLTVSIARASFTATGSSSRYIDGLTILVDIPSTITDVPLLGINGHTKYAIVGADGGTLSSSMILAGQKCLFSFDKSAKLWQMLTPSAKLFATQVLWKKGADVASAADLAPAADGNFFDVTGTTTITSIDSGDSTVPVGKLFILQFDGALTLTHHATDLVLPGGANITTAAGDVAIFYKYAAGDCLCIAYTKADGSSPVPATISQASASAIEAQTDENTYIPPDLVIRNPGVAKLWGHVTYSGGTPTLQTPSHNINSITDTATGQLTVTIETDFSDADYGLNVTSNDDETPAIARTWGGYPAVGSFVCYATNSAGTFVDPLGFWFAAFGDWA